MAHVNLNRKLVLEAPQRAPDGAGGFSETWIQLGTLWAEVKARTGRETLGEAVSLSNTGYRITVRAAEFGAPSRPAPEHRFRDGSRIFRILAVAEQDCNGRFLTCFADEEVAV